MSVAVSFPPNPSPFPPRAAQASNHVQPSGPTQQPTPPASNPRDISPPPGNPSESTLATSAPSLARGAPSPPPSTSAASLPPQQPPGTGTSGKVGGGGGAVANGNGSSVAKPAKREVPGSGGGGLHPHTSNAHNPKNPAPPERKDTLSIKRLLLDGLGRDDFRVYWRALGLFLTGRLTRTEMEERVDGMLGTRLKPLHNSLLISLIANAQLTPTKFTVNVASGTTALGSSAGVKRKAEWDTEEDEVGPDGGRVLKRSRGEEEEEEAPVFVPLRRPIPNSNPNSRILSGFSNVVLTAAPLSGTGPPEPIYPPSLTSIGDLYTHDQLRTRLRATVVAERVGEGVVLAGMGLVGQAMGQVQDSAVEMAALGVETYLKNLLSVCVAHVRSVGWTRPPAPLSAGYMQSSVIVSNVVDTTEPPITDEMDQPGAAEQWSEDEQEPGNKLLKELRGKRPSLALTFSSRAPNDSFGSFDKSESKERGINGVLNADGGGAKKLDLRGGNCLMRPRGSSKHSSPGTHEDAPTDGVVVDPNADGEETRTKADRGGTRLSLSDLLQTLAARPYLAPTFANSAQEAAIIEASVEEAEGRFWDGSYIREAEVQPNPRHDR
ncbi:hypothetical protein HDU93_006259 [Gonapodya sp. JEL0774]|nr:hypothetical protein HDU93_006259 [Gonapodya sp. JEL0774]